MATQFVGTTAPGAVGTSYGQASPTEIGQAQQDNPQLSTALLSGTAAVNFDANSGTYNLIDTTTGAPIPGNYQVQVSDAGVGINIPTSSGAMIQAAVNTDASGNISPVTANQVLNVGVNQGAGGFAGGGELAQDAVSVGLAYALPIVGQAIGAEMGISASLGTALAATAVNVAQGQDIGTAIQNAVPALIAKGIMSTDMVSDLVDSVSNDSSTRNVINNVAKSVTQTAVGGGTAQDLLNNAIASGGGTLIGQTLVGGGVDKGTAGAIGQGLASGAVSGNLMTGLTAGASTLGAADVAAQQKALQAEERGINAELNKTPLSTVSPEDQAVLDQIASQQPSPTGLSNVSVTGTPGVIGDTIIPKTPSLVLPNVGITEKPAVDTSDVVIPTTPSNVPSVGALQPVSVTGQKQTDLGDVTITGSDIPYSGNSILADPNAVKLQPVSVTGKKDVDLGDVTVTGSPIQLPDVTITAKRDDNVTTPNTTPIVPDDSNVSVTTSYVKPKTPKISAALPTIQGQFASPLTPSASAYIPAGEIPGTETGKPKEDVWNQESLREGLGI